jgi:hypothetical protein
MELGGSASTWLVSVAAIGLLWLRRWRRPGRVHRPGRGWPRVILILLGLWWIDLFTYTLPTWGLRRSILWGGTKSEPYEAAIALGVPGWLFQAFVVVSSIALATAWVVGIVRDRSKSALQISNNSSKSENAGAGSSEATGSEPRA